MKIKANDTSSIIIALSLILALFAPWFNHIIYCFKHHEYILLVAGAIVIPVGWLHGLGLWLGFW